MASCKWCGDTLSPASTGNPSPLRASLVEFYDMREPGRPWRDFSLTGATYGKFCPVRRGGTIVPAGFDVHELGH